MTVRSFGQSLLYAAIVAGAVLPALVVLAAVLGAPFARDAVLALAVAGYAAAFVEGPARRTAVFAGVVAFAAAFGALGAHTGELAVALAAALAVVRSGVAFRTRPARAAVIESGIGIGALALAEFLYSGTAVSFALALWGFFLVQSTYFLIGGRAVRSVEVAPEDPFEAAHRRAERLLEGGF